MAACERCWADAYLRMMAEPSKSQTEHYHDLLAERPRPCGTAKPPQRITIERDENGSPRRMLINPRIP